MSATGLRTRQRMDPRKYLLMETTENYTKNSLIRTYFNFLISRFENLKMLSRSFTYDVLPSCTIWRVLKVDLSGLKEREGVPGSYLHVWLI